MRLCRDVLFCKFFIAQSTRTDFTDKQVCFLAWGDLVRHRIDWAVRDAQVMRLKNTIWARPVEQLQ